MGLDAARARAKTHSLHHSALDVDYPVKAHRRQRSASVEATFVSTAVVPAHDSTEILSSLISSLTVLSNSAREQQGESQNPEASFAGSSVIDTYPDPFVSINSHDSFNLHDDALEEANDGDVAEAPVVGYYRGLSRTPKKPIKDKWATHRSDRSTELNLGGRGPSRARRAPSVNSTMGMPSIERSRAPSVNSTMGMPSIERSSTAASMHSVSRVSVDRPSPSPLRTFFMSRSSDEHDRALPAPIKDIDSRSIGRSRSRQNGQLVKDLARGDKTFDPSAVIASDDMPQVDRVMDTSPARRTHNPLAPANRQELSENVIPSRASSIRHSPSRASSKGRSPSSRRPPSASARSVKTPALDDVPIEEDDPTLRRIRELQLAKEKRQMDRLNESTLERLSRKVVSGTKSSRMRSSSKSTQRSVASTMDGLHATDIPPIPPIKKDTPKVPSVPVIQNMPASPVPSNTSARDSPMRLPPTNSAINSIPSTPQSHKRTFSGGLRRSASIKRTSTLDIKSVTEQVDAFLTAPRLTQRIRHPRTGRTIAFSEVGDPDGFVVFVCVGMGLTRYVTLFYDDVARTQKLRLITPDRPGTGESDPFPDTTNTPLAWADDVTVICHSLNITKFSLLAYSAGTIYALGTALKMPQYVRGKIHLLAPWIPPSQMAAAGQPNVKGANLPTAHRFLSKLPTQFLKAANSRFLSATGAGIDSGSGRKKDRGNAQYESLLNDMAGDIARSASQGTISGRMSALSSHDTSFTPILSPSLSSSPLPGSTLGLSSPGTRSMLASPTPTPTEALSPQARQALFNSTLTRRTWQLATANANPANDLIVCLERRRPIGFFYRDVTRGVIIHHGRHDARVPLENVRWLESVMRPCELRILEDEDHGLMASAKVMSEVLSEIGREWEEWEVRAKDKEERKKTREAEKERVLREQRGKFIRKGHY